MSQERRAIRWLSDVTPALWWSVRLDDSYDRVSALVPSGYESYARLPHQGIALPVRAARILIDMLAGETRTPDRCWFCVVDRYLEVDDQGVAERVTLPSGGSSYLLHQGPISMAVAEPPARVPESALNVGPRTTLEELADELEKQRGVPFGYLSTSKPTVSEAMALLGDQPPFLPEEAAAAWWPDDRAWFVATDLYWGSTYIAGKRGLIDRLRADSAVEASETRLTDSLLTT